MSPHVETLTRMGLGRAWVLRPPRADVGELKDVRNRRHLGLATTLNIVRMALSDKLGLPEAPGKALYQ